MNEEQFKKYKKNCYHHYTEHNNYPKNGYCCQYKGECEYKYCFVSIMIDELIGGKLSLWIAPPRTISPGLAKKLILYYVEEQHDDA